MVSTGEGGGKEGGKEARKEKKDCIITPILAYSAKDM